MLVLPHDNLPERMIWERIWLKECLPREMKIDSVSTAWSSLPQNQKWHF